ncbi:type VI secretion system baseplate subunit TssK [Marinibactrum halimedae]|uniref:Type VI secretion system baseplate subunit TssK n=1 Tax=Marinibactrum halimedae TaxID=1444977 RepID=A0AA37WKJ5_9GAMM|nr:type VI secretion system baseplate subunit TssK [Marinibactrum halimedae]MCD9458104.1 type VI secretion system baseplate subunit TssK [Marinibactrum halimedae]GLS25038.1 hypothetical protein GCM10007877_07520 [Marinibactrum halimedae]
MSHVVPAPVKWEFGQALLPEHLMAQEEALIAEASGRMSVNGLPDFGISTIEWDDALLSNEAIVSIKRLKLLTRNGVLLDYPNNTNIVSPPVELKEHLNHKVYYYLLRELPPVNDGTVTSLIPKGQKIGRRHLKLILTCEQVLPKEYHSLLDDHEHIDSGCIGYFEKPYQQGWQLSSEYTPPLLQIGNSQYLIRSLSQLLTVMKRFRADLRQEFGAKNLPKTLLFGVKQCLHEIQKNIRLLENLNIGGMQNGELRIHPYILYESLQCLLTDIQLYRGEWPEREPETYRHGALSEIFLELIDQIALRMQFNSSSVYIHEFILKDGIYSVPTPSEMTELDSLYLVVDVNNQAPLEEINLPCVTSVERLKTLNTYALAGVGLKLAENPTFGYEFGKKVYCYEICSGGERAYLHRDGTIAFYAQEYFKSMNFYLYKKLPSKLLEMSK